MTDNQKARIESHIAAGRQKPGALLPILHAIQDDLGFVPPASYPDIAQALNLSVAEVHGVVSFYHHFRSSPPGRHTLQVCRAESCQAVGSVALESHVREKLGIDYHETTPDGAITLEPVYCLGNCACSPSVLVDDEVHGRVTPEYLDRVIASLKGQA